MRVAVLYENTIGFVEMRLSIILPRVGVEEGRGLVGGLERGEIIARSVENGDLSCCTELYVMLSS